MISARIAARLRTLLPAVALAGLLIAVISQQPRAASYFGLNLLLNLAIPIIFATLAQVVILAVSDIDLSVGAFVSLTATIGATLLPNSPGIAVTAYVLCIAAYAAVGALVEWRGLPAIVVTLGMSFVWLGCAVLLLPTPGGTAPGWLSSALRLQPPFVPLPIWVALAAAVFGHLLISRSAFGTCMRGLVVSRRLWRVPANRWSDCARRSMPARGCLASSPV